MPTFKPYTLQREGYRVSAKKSEEAEISMYGEIVEQRPVDFWTGQQIEGDFIIQSEFLNDLNDVIGKGCKNLTLRLNSPGGDAGVSIVIHNKLRELQSEGLNVTAIIDGIAMSGGSLIMCACDKVKVNPSSLIMIHKCWSFYYGAYNADELRELASSQDAFDKAQCSIYTRKTGLSETKVMHLMSETTYMTGAEAVENGFADEVIESAEPLKMSASANRDTIFCNGRAYHLARNMIAPENLPVEEEKQVSTAETEDINTLSGSDTDCETEENRLMATNLNELRDENAELATAVETEVRAAVSAENASAIEAAVASERARISAIDEIASLYDSEMVREAKYGEHPCSAQELAFKAAQIAAKTGSAFMASVKEDAESTDGANGVPSAEAPEDTEKTPEDKQAETDAIIHALLKKEEA